MSPRETDAATGMSRRPATTATLSGTVRSGSSAFRTIATSMARNSANPAGTARSRAAAVSHSPIEMTNSTAASGTRMRT